MKIRTTSLIMFLTVFPVFSTAADCTIIKEQYWACVRASMTGKECEENISIPSECLTHGASIGSTLERSKNSSIYPENSDSNFFSFKKESASSYTPDSEPSKPVTRINLKTLNSKMYFDTEEDVDVFISRLKDEMHSAIKDGKRVHLQYH